MNDYSAHYTMRFLFYPSRSLSASIGSASSFFCLCVMDYNTTMMMMMNGMSPRTITSQPSTEAMFDDNFSIMPKVIDNDNRQRNLNIRNKRQLSSLLSPLQIRFGRLQMDRRSSTSSINGRQKQSSSSLLNGYSYRLKIIFFFYLSSG